MGRVLTKPLVYHYGDSFNKYAVLWEDANGAPINLTGWTATMRIKAKAGGGTGEPLVLELNSSGQGLSIDAVNGRINFNATPTKMKSGSLAPAGGQYAYDLQVSNGVDAETLVKGPFWVDPEVTET